MTAIPSDNNIKLVHEKDCSTWLGTYGNLIQSVAITALDVIFLLGSLFSSVPQILTHTAFTTLNFAGIISWSFYVDQTKKNIEDARFSFKNKNHFVTFAASLKTMFIVTSIALLSLNICAATFQLITLSVITQRIYTFTRPFGIPSLAVSVFLDFLYYCLAKTALSIKVDQESLPQLFQNFQNNKINNGQSINASYIRGCLDKDTWKHLVTQLPHTSRNQQKELYHKVLMRNILTQQTAIVSNLFLRTMGEIGMFVSIVYPGTTIQAACWTILSSLYTGQLACQHYHQRKQRQFASEISFL